MSIIVGGRQLPEPGTTGEAAGPDRTVYHTPAGTVTDVLEPFPKFPNCVARHIIFTNAADEQRDLTGADFLLAPAAPSTAKMWQAQSFAMVECAPGGPTLCVAYTSDEDHWSCNLQMTPQPLVRHHVGAAWRLPPGGQATIGTEYIWVVDGGIEKARASAQDWYDAVGLTVADGGPPWLGDCIIYQACAGGSVDSRWGDIGGFDNFARQLDYISDLGCNAFWLMCVLTHKDPNNPKGLWNLYDPYNYHQIDPVYGGEPALTRLVHAMRDRNFRVFNEIVPHGGHAQLCIDHPEWWSYEANGKHRKSFGLSLDYSSPGWQATIKDTIHWLTAGWGFDGYRVDVADGYGINWKSPTNGAHVSRSTMGGSIGMLKAIREGAIAGGDKDPVVIPETGADRSEYARYGQLGYGSSLLLFVENEFAKAPLPAELRQAFTDFFVNEQGSLPRGMLSIRTLNNHDTVVALGRADRRFGVGLQQALTGICTVVRGVPMIYQEQEVGSYDYFRHLFWGRQRVPEMGRGAADYVSVKAPPEVFPVLRTYRNTHAVGLVNLSWQPVDAQVTLPPGVIPPRGTTLYDAVSGSELRVTSPRFTWRLAPYATAILRVGSPPVGPLPPERARPMSESNVPSNAPLRLNETGGQTRFAVHGLAGSITATNATVHVEQLNGDRIKIHATATKPGEGELAIQLIGVNRWFTATETGVYTDRLLRRHYPWPGSYRWDPTIVWGFEPYNLYRGVLPAGRQWQSAVAPLAANGPQIGFAGSNGTGLVLSEIATNAANVILSDRSEQPDPEPYGLTLRFVAHDPDLNPNWIPAYRKAPWTEVPAPSGASDDQPLEVSLVLAPLTDFRQTVAAVQPAAPAVRGRRVIGPGEAHDSVGRLWLVQPNTVTLSDLPLSHDGAYTLWMQLRHSESGPAGRDLCDQYKVSLDGHELQLQWVKLDVWHTGNGYFGWAKADAGTLAAGTHVLTVRTTHTWCAISPQIYISRDPRFTP